MNSNKLQDLITKAKLQIIGLNLLAEDSKINNGLSQLSYLLDEINFEITKASFQINPNKFHILED